MKCLWLLLTTLLVPVHLAGAWPPKYAVDCPAQCDSNQSKTSQCCKQTVLDDCGCCRVCAGAAGERCYRMVSGVDRAKCGPGLQCQFSNLQDVFGEEFGICKECPYGTFGMNCQEICKCPSVICDKVNGKCLKFSFFQANSKPSGRRSVAPSDHDMASGDGNSVKKQFVKKNGTRSPVMKWLNPR
ncbi:endothelial cell-specific molecule 1-like isoform X1 [Gracilinanus agilis]|uniref:endothelial cell-specific molecule 1-like isoform X1 n=1 Tax=Gracilinanus agilis TaxID=191870 RepID=UPI001CFC7124|nr:endothelial cell-specific molecule 1-like isoform X1 [Gracilinanus agilis]